MIKRVKGALCEELTYFYIDDTTNHGFVIDPGLEGKSLAKYAKEQGYIIEKILLTHGHGDHIWGAQSLREELGIPIVIHEEGKAYITDPIWNMSISLGGKAIHFEADEYVKDGDIIALKSNAQFNLKVIYIPGHSKDGVAYYDKAHQLVFVGDILFAGSVGRSDLYGSDTGALLNGIRSRLFTLPPETTVYPGHGIKTTIGYEMKTNPVFHFYD